MLESLASTIEITSQRGISCVSAIEGDIDDDAEARRLLEAELFRRIAESDILIDVVSIDDEGAFFIVDTRRLDDLRLELTTLNVALRVRPNCTRFSVWDRRARRGSVPEHLTPCPYLAGVLAEVKTKTAALPSTSDIAKHDICADESDHFAAVKPNVNVSRLVVVGY